MLKRRDDLRPLISPRTIAVVGASPDSWYSSQIVNNLLEFGFEGDLYLVNPGREEVWGRRCYDDITDVPATVDLAVISIPREYVVETVENAARTGVPAALIITAGFAEADDDGAEMEQHLRTVAETHDIRICGPNCLGLINTLDEITLTPTCSRTPVPGSVGLISHSGALAFTTFHERGMDEDTGFAYVISTGNEADLSIADYVEYLASDERVDVVCTYVEGIERGGEFLDAADAAVRNDVPMLTVKVGRSAAAERATISHTGSVTGNDQVWKAAFDQVGIQRVPDIPDLLATATIHSRYDPPESRDVCIASTSGGLASLLADFCSEYGLSLPDIEGETERQLVGKEELLTFGTVTNPIDIRGYGADHLPEIADVLFADDRFSAYVFAIGLSAVDERAEEIATDLRSIAERATDPVVCLWTGRKEPQSHRDRQPFERVREQLPVYYDPETAVRSLASLIEFGSIKRARTGTDSRRALREGFDRRQGPDLSAGVLPWAAATAALRRYGIEPVPTRLVSEANQAVAASEHLGYPVSMKVESVDIPHRTDADAVRLAVADERDARNAFSEILDNARSYQPGADIEGVLVQPHVDGGTETMVGIIEDDSLGRVVAFGLGGTAVEQIRDQTYLVPPYTEAEVRTALANTRLEERFEHRRTGNRADVDGFVDLLVRIGTFAYETPAVKELDLNPVLVGEEGCSIVDVLLVGKE